ARSPSSAPRPVRRLVLWSRRYRLCLQSHSFGNGPARQIGSPSSSSPPALFWSAADQCRGEAEAFGAQPRQSRGTSLTLVRVQKGRFLSDVARRDQTDCSACAGTFVLQ